MAYIAPSSSAVGTKLSVEIRGTHTEAKVVALPFYQRK
jgi:aminomethyltransferase